MEEYKINTHKKFILPLAVILLLVLALIMTYLNNNQKKEAKINESVDYVISGVPYFGIYNHKDYASYVGYYSGGDSCAAFASILTYWNPEQKIDDNTCDSVKSNSEGFIGADSFANALNPRGFETKEVNLNIDELKKYINPKVKTPLIFFLPISGDQPTDLIYAPARILIGIKESERKLVYHDYWLGNNYEITYDEFNKLKEKMNPAQKNLYVLAQPNNLNEELIEISSRKIDAYPARTSVMHNAEGMFKDYAIGSGGAYRFKNWPVALDYLLKVKDSSNFEKYFPPYFKVMLYYQLSKTYLQKNDFDNAFIWAQKSVDANHNLDQPFNDWLGYDDPINSNPGTAKWPYWAMGDYYFNKGNFDIALENYKKSLEICPVSINAKEKIVAAEKALAEQ